MRGGRVEATVRAMAAGCLSLFAAEPLGRALVGGVLMYRAQLAFLAIAFAVPAARAASTNGDPANASRDPVGAVPSVAARPAPTVGDTWVYRRVDLFTGLEMNRWQVRFVGSDTAGWHLKTAGGS